MSAHTPGPWKVGNADAMRGDWTCYDDSASSSAWQPVVRADDVVVAMVVDSAATYKLRDSFVPDMSLIAAAPELLALLKCFAYPGEYEGRPSDEALRQEARELIAKATEAA